MCLGVVLTAHVTEYLGECVIPWAPVSPLMTVAVVTCRVKGGW